MTHAEKNEKYSFAPGYWEWHLIDDKGRIILNIPDPYDSELAECKTCKDVLRLCEDWYSEACRHYESGEDFNGVKADPALISPACHAGTGLAKVMAKALYDYYIKPCA